MHAIAIRRTGNRDCTSALHFPLGVLALAVGVAAATSASAIGISASVDGSDFQVGSTSTISLVLTLDPGEELSSLEVSILFVGAGGIEFSVLSADPDRLFATAVGNFEGDSLRLSYTRTNSDSDGLLAEIEIIWKREGALHVVLEDVIAGVDIVDPPYLESLDSTPFAGTPLTSLGEAEDFDAMFEDFDALELQGDDTGVVIDEQTTYLVYDGPDRVASVTGARAAETGIGAEGENRFWILTSSPGDTLASAGSLLIGDLPAMAPGSGYGSFADGFASPRNLIGTELRARVQEATGSGATNVRALLVDVEGREVASAWIALSGSFQDLSLQVHEDFSELVGDATGFSFAEVIGIALEFHTDQADAPGFGFRVDDVEVVPEPASGLLAASVLVTLGWLVPRRPRATAVQ